MFYDIGTLWTEKSDFYLQLLMEHMQISLTAVVIAGVLGLCIGILIAEYERTSKVALSIINFMYTIPSISLLGFLIPLSGIGNTTAILALIIYALLPMVRNTHTGIHNVSPLIIEAAKGMGSTRMQILYKIKLPLALPIIVTGIRNMAVMTIALAGIASFIGAGGLGVAIYRGITTNNKAMTFMGSLLIAFLAIVFDWILSRIEKMFYRKRQSSKVRGKWLVGASAVLLMLLVVLPFVKPSPKDILHIATKPMTEQYVLGEMMKLVIEQHMDIEVNITQGVGGGTSNIHPGMESDAFDMYPEYTGTGWNQVLKKQELYTEDLFPQLQQGYQEMQMIWEPMLGFNNTYAIAVRKDIADTYALETFSDLQKVADQLIFGAEYDYFEREDGFDALCDTYGLSFKGTLDLDIGLKYDAIREQKIDVMCVFTTDGQLSATNIKVLKDDKNMYPSYMCGFVVREEVFATYPNLQEVLQMLDHRIRDEDMSEMNYAVETLKKAPKDVAENFLKENNLWKEGA